MYVCIDPKKSISFRSERSTIHSQARREGWKDGREGRMVGREDGRMDRWNAGMLGVGKRYG